MKVSYQNTLGQLVALQKFVLRHTPFGRKMMLHRFIMVEIVLFLICLMFAFNHSRIKVLSIFLLFSGIAWLFRERAVLMQFKKDFKREERRDESGAFHKSRVLSIDPRGFSLATGARDHRYSWNQVQHIDRDANYLYIVLEGVLHHIIPLSAFKNQETADKFVSTMIAYWKAD
ncbi:MAG: YcxB family protein [Desulfosarcinaceae bacterium]|jgi:hypothetical protein